MKEYVCKLLLLGAVAVLTMPPAFAQEAAHPAKKSAKAAHKKIAKKAKKKTVEKSDVTDEDDIQPDITGSTVVDYHCELGNNLTIYENQADPDHVALRWKKQLHRLKRVNTTTGAHRFENKKYGLLWIGIPAKGILLNSKKGVQLANECKNAEQMHVKPQQAPDANTTLLGVSKPSIAEASQAPQLAEQRP